MDDFRGLLDIRRMDNIFNAWVREWCGTKKGMDEKKIDGSVLEF